MRNFQKKPLDGSVNVTDFLSALIVPSTHGQRKSQPEPLLESSMRAFAATIVQPVGAV